MTEKNKNEIPQLKTFRRAVLLESVSALGPRRLSEYYPLKGLLSIQGIHIHSSVRG